MSNRTILNVVVGTSYLKIISAVKKDTEIVVKNLAHVSEEGMLFISQDKINYKLLEEKIREYMYSNKIKSGSICYILPDTIIKTQIITKPHAIDEDYLNTIFKENLIEELIDNISEEDEGEIDFDCQILNISKGSEKKEKADDFTELLISIIKKDVVKNLKKISKKLKLRPEILEGEITALIRIIEKYKKSGNYMIMDIGANTTKVHCIYYGSSIDASLIEFGIEEIDNLYSSIFGCDIFISENIRKKYGLDVPKGKDLLENYLKEHIITPLFGIIDDIQNVYGDMSYINELYAVGGGWNVNGMEEYLIKNVALYFNRFNLWENLTFENKEVEEKARANATTFSSCLSLTLRGGL